MLAALSKRIPAFSRTRCERTFSVFAIAMMRSNLSPSKPKLREASAISVASPRRQ
jgi:hypothetical protein